MSSRWPISIEKNSTGLRSSSATCSAAPSAKRRLALARTGRDDRERRRLEPEQQRVEVVVAGRHADDRRCRGRRGCSSCVHRLLERGVQLHQRVGDAVLGDLEDHRLGAVERLVDVVVGRVAPSPGCRRATPISRRSIDELGDDLRVVLGVRRRGRRGLDPQQRLAPPSASSWPARRSSSATVTGSTGSPRPCSRYIGVEDQAVRGLVEVARLDVRLDRGGDRLAATASSRRAATPRPRGCAAGSARRWLRDADVLDRLDHVVPSRRVVGQRASRRSASMRSDRGPSGGRESRTSACGSIEAQPCDLPVDEPARSVHSAGDDARRL